MTHFSLSITPLEDCYETKFFSYKRKRKSKAILFTKTREEAIEKVFTLINQLDEKAKS